GRSGGSGRSGARRGGGFEGFEGPVEGSSAAEVPPANPEAVARAVCLRLLTMAPRTRAQLAEALRKRNVPDDVAESVLARFSDVGLIDDEAFAEAWVSSRHAGRGLARRALASELRKRGVDEDTVRDAVDQLDPDQELETARRLVERKLPGTRGLEPAARVRRLAGMLARKGYSGSLAYRVVREALESEGLATDDLPDGFE
ncbi:recombination regulator RecX, partial [Sphaerisporangium sp. NPDC049003]|uniref:recombination regulator RecX n=1 Tax=Sphaerisporangium sp. NPDC049003 TaxID=3364517 RepID=UPI0037212055